MKAKKGFTLVELLVAATIIGILAMLATTAYRNSVAETRWTQAKAQADRLGAAVQAMDAAREGVRFRSPGTISSGSAGGACTIYSAARTSGTYTVSAGQLLACGFLEPGDVNNEYFTFSVRVTGAAWTALGNPLACVSAKANTKLPSKYSSASYCVFEGSAPTETF